MSTEVAPDATRATDGLPATRSSTINIVIIALSVLALICVGTLSYCMCKDVKPDPTLLTAFIGLTTGLTSALATLLVNTRSSGGGPIAMRVTNSKRDPVPTAPTK